MWTGIVPGAVVLLLLVYVIALYNSLIQVKNRVDNGWAQIDVQLRRRYDLIPNLVEAVKGYMTHEREVLTQVTAARAQATAVSGDPATQGQAEGMLTGTLRQLFAVAENYPQLKADANFRQLQADLTDTESKIAFSRQFYNDTVMMFNTRIAVFPANLISGMLGFRSRAYFQVEEPAARGPVKVQFGPPATGGSAQ